MQQQGMSLDTFGTSGAVSDDIRTSRRNTYQNMGIQGPGKQQAYLEGLNRVDHPKQNAVDAAPKTLADEFRDNQQGISDQVFENTAGLERRRLADEMTGVKRDYSRRGLLQSGLRQGEQGKAEARSGTALAQNRQDINRQISDQQRVLDEQAARKELGALQTQAAISDQIQGQAISNMMNRNSALSGLGGAIGQGVGAYFGSKK